MNLTGFSFDLPNELNATTPPERRGLRRDFVKMMVLDRWNGCTTHTQFYQLDRFLKKGDLLVLNASRTVPAVLVANWYRNHSCIQADVEVRLARKLTEDSWECLPVIEGFQVGDRLEFSPQLHAWVTEVGNRPFVTLYFSIQGGELFEQFYQLGEPVRYEYIESPWNLDYYQTVYATIPGSVEMPSAGRAFSWELLFKLQRKGIQLAFIQLHTGLSYLLDDQWHQNPRDNYEPYVVSKDTIQYIHHTKEMGGRVIAVGTTVVRALESAVDLYGNPMESSGWTNLAIHPDYSLQVVDGLITGFHEPEASHLDLLSTFIQPNQLYKAYQEAIDLHYLWHEFGDMNLII